MFRTKPLMVILTVIVVIVVAFLSFGSKYAKQAPQTVSPSSPENQAPLAPDATNNAAKTQAPATPPTQPTKAISITSPAASEKWIIGETNTIRWNREGGLPGQIYIVRASDKATVGWINSETGPHQTSVTWNGKDVAIGRYSSASKSVDHGSYIIRIKFDTKNIPEVSSGAFSLVYKSEVPVGNYSITIKGYAFSPTSLNVKKNDKLTFINNDPVTQRIAISGTPPFVIEPGGSYIFDTSSLFPGSYNFYSDVYPSLKLNVNVQ